MALIFMMAFSYSASASASKLKEYARISNASYETDTKKLNAMKKNKPIGKFKLVDVSKPNKNGMDAQTWADNANNYVIVFRGTDGARDKQEDLLSLGLNLGNAQITSATSYVESQLKKNRNMKSLVITGHSLGGYLAQWVMTECVDGQLTSCDPTKTSAVTFQAPGFNWALFVDPEQPSDINKKIRNEHDGAYDKYIMNHLVKGDLINAVGNSIGLITNHEPLSNIKNAHSLNQFINRPNF
jgi:Protein of unknown function (DUF2974)